MTADVSGMFVNQCTVTDKHCIDGCVQCSANQNTLISHMLDSYVKPIDSRRTDVSMEENFRGFERSNKIV